MYQNRLGDGLLKKKTFENFWQPKGTGNYFQAPFGFSIVF